MANKLNKLILLSLSIILLGCHKLENKNLMINKILEMPMNIPAESKIDSTIEYLTNEIGHGNLNYHLQRGFYYWLAKDDKKAIKDFNFIIRTDSTNSNAYLGIGLSYIHLKPDSALVFINKSISLNPKNAYAYFYRSFRHKNIKSFTDINKAIKLMPNCSMFYSWRGVFYDSIDSTKSAIRDFKKSTELDKNIVLNYTFLNSLLYENKSYKEAIKYANLEIEAFPFKASAYYNRGLSYNAIGQNKNSVRDFELAIKYFDTDNSSDKSDCYFHISESYAQLDSKDSTLKYLKLAINNNSRYAGWAREDTCYLKFKNQREFNIILQSK